MAALQQLRFASAVSSLLPRIWGPAFASSSRSAVLFTHARASPSPSWPSLAVAIPAAIQTIPGILGDIWEGILKAVPKSKTSHMKKRHRQMAGKALKDVTNLNKCPACGAIKKQHTLCTQCMGSELGPSSRAPLGLSLTASQRSRACSPTRRKRNPTSICEHSPVCEKGLLYQNHRNIASDRRWGPARGDRNGLFRLGGPVRFGTKCNKIIYHVMYYDAIKIAKRAAAGCTVAVWRRCWPGLHGRPRLWMFMLDFFFLT